MKILALEFSSEQRSVALVEESSGALLGYASEAGGREMKALGLVQAVLTEAGCGKEDIHCIAVGLGPGSYTGIRAAISLAQGWQLARGTKVLGISSADVLAKSAQMSGICGHIQILIDAQRHEFYTARYEVQAGHVHEMERLELVPAASITANDTAVVIVGPEANDGTKRVFPDARGLALLAIGRKDYLPGARLEPIYLRETTFVKAPPPRVLPE